MGKLLKILGALFLVLVVGFVALLVWSHERGESVQEDFFAAVLGGDPTGVKALLSPEIADQVDVPYLQAWMEAVKLHLGAFKGLAATNFKTSVSTENGHEVVVSEGTVDFERGSAQSKLRLVDGKIVAFHVAAPGRMPDNWFTRLDDASLYEQRATAFLRNLLEGKADAALAMMHEDLRAKFEPEKLASALADLGARYGKVAGLRVAGTEFKAGPRPAVVVRIAVDGANEDGVGVVHFGFVEMRGVVIEFHMPES